MKWRKKRGEVEIAKSQPDIETLGAMGGMASEAPPPNLGDSGQGAKVSGEIDSDRRILDNSGQLELTAIGTLGGHTYNTRIRVVAHAIRDSKPPVNGGPFHLRGIPQQLYV